MVFNMIGNGNNTLAVSHHSVINFFNSPRSEAVSSMKSGHELYSGSFGCPIGAPRRRTRTGMNNINPVITDYFLQSTGVSAHCKRIFALERQGKMRDFQLIKVINHTSALRGHEIFDSVLLQFGGDLDRSDFNAAGFHLGQNLQDNRCFIFTAAHF